MINKSDIVNWSNFVQVTPILFTQCSASVFSPTCFSTFFTRKKNIFSHFIGEFLDLSLLSQKKKFTFSQQNKEKFSLWSLCVFLCSGTIDIAGIWFAFKGPVSNL